MKITNEAIRQLDELQAVYNDSVHEILKNEALSLNPYKKGDIISDHYQVGKVLKAIISISIYSRAYEISYRCERLTKKLKPYRGGDITTIYLDNVEHCLNNKEDNV